MDLDKIKKTWVAKDPKFSVTDDDLKLILSARRNSAMKKLISYEKYSILAFPFIALFPFLHDYLFPLTTYPMCSKIFFSITCFLCFFWAVYKYVYLTRIDTKKDNIIYCMRRMILFRKYICYELFVGLVFAFGMIISLFIPWIKLVLKEYLSLFIILVFGLLVFMSCAIYIFYKCFSQKQIKYLQNSLLEIKNLEKEN